MALFAICILVAVFVELLRMWRRNGFLEFAAQLAWVCFLGGVAVFIVSTILVAASWLLDADHLVRVVGRVAGWSFVLSCVGLPCCLQAQRQLSRRQAVE